VEGPVTSIAETWPNLPHSFTQGVHGAANVNGDPYVFRDFIPVDLTSGVTAGPAPISSPAWWQGHVPDDWAADGIDAAFRYGETDLTVYRGRPWSW
jgi:hypothetical protein